MTRMLSRSASIALLFLLVSSPLARADWSAVRDMVRAAEKMTDDDKQESAYRNAYAAAQKSVAANPNVSNEHLWMAAAAGRLAQVASNSERVALSKVVKEHAERAIELDPKNGSAYMALGAWHFYMADLSWMAKTAAKALYGGLPPATFKDAVANLTKALQNGAENQVEIYFLRGRAYEEMDDDASAMADFRRCVAAKARDANDQQTQRKAADKLD